MSKNMTKWRISAHEGSRKPHELGRKGRGVRVKKEGRGEVVSKEQGKGVNKRRERSEESQRREKKMKI